jgi:putative ABC transport system permease protein
MQIEIINGRNFSLKNATDKTEAIIINETLQNQLGWADAVGKKVQVKLDDGRVFDKKIVGVIKDFHTYSLQHKVQPMVLAMPPDPSFEDNLYVRINSASTTDALAYIEKTFKEFDKVTPIEINFLDQNFDRQYAREQKQGQLSLVFTIIAVFIACLGLFGLAAFTAQQRVKEIGIRKALGASVRNIIGLLSGEFVKLVVIAAVIAGPLAWWGMNKWLEDFAYHVNASAWVIVLSGVVALVIALITVSTQAYVAALANPVKSLRSE